MSQSMFNPKPNYSGVTIQILNPAVNVGENPNIQGDLRQNNKGYVNNSQGYCNYLGCCCQQHIQDGYTTPPQGISIQNPADTAVNNIDYPHKNQSTNNSSMPVPQNYPANYYMNNYNYGNQIGTGANGNSEEGLTINQNQSGLNTNPTDNLINKKIDAKTQDQYNGEEYNKTEQAELANNLYGNYETPKQGSHVVQNYDPAAYKHYAKDISQKEEDMTTSKNIIEDLTKRDEEIQEEKKNTKEKRIVALTDEYIKSLENYLNNPNDEIRLMASKEILTRLDEDKDRYNDAALNALLNKMLQDPSKLVRIAALSALSSQLASGNNYTVKLLNGIQSNPNADKEDVLQAADILLKMSAGTEVKRIPNPQMKENQKTEG